MTESLRLFVCGRNSFGQLGLGHIKPVETPTPIPVQATQTLGDTKVEQVSCGAEHTLILTGSRDLFACGLNVKGQLSTGDTENRLISTQIDPFQLRKRSQSRGDRVAIIACGALHSVLCTGSQFYRENPCNDLWVRWGLRPRPQCWR